jgi:glycosyltransferase involved in cell wall biosynthesis
LNAHLLNLSGNYRTAGINWCIYHLLEHLPTAAPDLNFTAFCSEPRAPAEFPALSFVLSRLPTHQPYARIFWEQFIQPVAVRTQKIDLLHSLAFVQPLVLGLPSVVTLYDLSFLLFPASFHALNRLYLTLGTRFSVQRADHLIAISESTRRDAVRFFNVPPEKISVIHLGVESYFTPAADSTSVAEWRRTRGLPDKFLLFVGTLEPRKNVPRLLRAFARVKKSARLPHKLVIVGARGWLYADAERTIEAENLANEVIFAGHVDHRDLPDWYRAAEALVYPSLYEGFGLPPLEAMACGTPVVTSNASSLPEVVGDAGLTVDPQDDAGLADALARVLTDPRVRAELSTRGVAQAARFSWARHAQETVAVYRSVIADCRLPNPKSAIRNQPEGGADESA